VVTATAATHRARRSLAIEGRTKESLELAIAAAVVIVIYYLVSKGNRAPVVYSDELANLGNASWISGGNYGYMGGASPEGVGYPILIAPLFHFFHSPEVLYRAVVFENIAFIAILLITSYLACRMVLSCGHQIALAGAIVACAYPPIAIDVGIAWPETAAMAAASLFVVTAAYVRRHPGVISVLCHCGMAALLAMLHGRFVVVPFLTAAWLVLLVVGRRVSIISAISGLIVLGAGHVLNSHLISAVLDARWAKGVQISRLGIGDVVATLPSEFLRSLFGQLWYISAATLGLAFIGVFATALRFWRLDAPVGWFNRLCQSSDGFYLGLAYASVAFVSVAYMAVFLKATPADARFDHIFYGRYVDSWSPVYIGLGIAALLARSRAARWALAVTAPMSVLLGLGTLLFWGVIPRSGKFSQYTSTGLGPLLSSKVPVVTSVAFIVPTLVLAASLMLVMVVVSRTWVNFVVAVPLVCFVWVATYNHDHLAAPIAAQAAASADRNELRDLNLATVAYDTSLTNIFGTYGLPYWLNNSKFEYFSSTASGAAPWPKADGYVGPATWPAAADRGLTRAALDRFDGLAIWVSSP
jgi:hypothetical protein